MFVWWKYVYAYFVYIRMMSSGPAGHQRQEPFFDLSFYLKVGYNTSFRGFDGLSSTSGSKIMAKILKIN